MSYALTTIPHVDRFVLPITVGDLRNILGSGDTYSSWTSVRPAHDSLRSHGDL